MKNKEFYKLLKKNKSNSGFTLTELLVGLFMSIFVIGALGFGLMTVLATSQSENSKVKARTENSRALDFISDEVRRARTIETDETNAPRFTISGAIVVLALDIPIINDDVTLDTDSDATVKDERVIYYLKDSSTPWKGPLVLYRWGPPLDANGEYSPKTGGTSNHWAAQALLDGINDKPIASSVLTESCPSPGLVAPVADSPRGFYACITGANTAQLFLTGQTKTASGRYDDTQTNDSQVVARAREALDDRTDENDSISWSVRGLDGALGCKGTDTWDMRTDFGNNPDNPDDTTKWVQKRDGARQPQPIAIKTEERLVVTGSAVNGTGCLNSARGNPDKTGADNELLSSYTNKVWHEINFDDPTTFNGDHKDGTYNDSLVAGTDPVDRSREAVQFFKRGSSIPKYGGYDADKDGVIDPAEGDQKTLGQFLFDKGLAIPLDGGDPNDKDTEFKILTSLNKPNDDEDEDTDLTAYLNSISDNSARIAEQNRLTLLGKDQRIVGMEIGQKYPDKNNDGITLPLNADNTAGKNSGFDLQDNIFVVTSKVFETKFESSCFSGGNCDPSTGKPNP